MIGGKEKGLTQGDEATDRSSVETEAADAEPDHDPQGGMHGCAGTEYDSAEGEGHAAAGEGGEVEVAVVDLDDLRGHGDDQSVNQPAELSFPQECLWAERGQRK